MFSSRLRTAYFNSSDTKYTLICINCVGADGEANMFSYPEGKRSVDVFWINWIITGH